QGLALNLTGDILPVSDDDVSWTAGIKFNLNRNEVTALTGELEEQMIEQNKLKIGDAVDNFWLLKNEGIYNSESDIPAGLTNNGVPFAVGDARWVDQNNDLDINEDDKVFSGRFTPSFFGGFNNSFAY